MDDSAVKMLQQLGGSAAAPALAEAALPSPAAAAGAGAPDDLDSWRILLVELVYLLNTLYRDAQYWEGIRTEKDTFRLFVKVLHQLSQAPRQDGRVRVKRRGVLAGKASEKPDYEITVGDVYIDAATMAALIKRLGIRFKHLEGRFLKPLETFASENIDQLVLKLPGDDPDENDELRVALRILSCFRQASEKGTALSFTRQGQAVSLKVVVDDKGRPDLNLTLLAAANALPAEEMQDIVRKVSEALQRPEAARLKAAAANIYKAIFAIKSLSGRLRRPPLEVNPERRSSDSGHEAAGLGGGPGGGSAGSIGGGRGGDSHAGEAAAGGQGRAAGAEAAPANPSEAQNRMDDGQLKAELSKIVKDAFQQNPGAASAIARSLFAQDFGGIGVEVLGERLGVLNHLLGALSKSPAGARLKEAVLDRVQAGFAQLPEQVLNDLVVENGVVRAWDGEKEKAVGQVEEHLSKAIDKAKDQAAARAKIRPVSGSEPIYMARDLNALAEYFGVPSEDMKSILSTFRSCFDGNGRFQRAAFEKKVPEFTRHPRRILHVLWAFLKETPDRSDRVAFLNSLQVLVKGLQQPILGIRVVVSDFLGERSQVNYSDRNALMLANQFLRTYNKEINVDIELTPEEVLLVKVGLDTKVAAYAAWKIKGEQNRFLEKVVAIRKRLIGAFDSVQFMAQAMPLRFLLALEREVHMFLALAGGSTSAAILHSALTVYGNPESQVFLADEARQNLTPLLQHLAVLIRGVARVGGENDLLLLDQVKQRERSFSGLSADPRHAGLVRRVMGWVEPAKKEISARLKSPA